MINNNTFGYFKMFDNNVTHNSYNRRRFSCDGNVEFFFFFFKRFCSKICLGVSVVTKCEGSSGIISIRFIVFRRSKLNNLIKTDTSFTTTLLLYWTAIRRWFYTITKAVGRNSGSGAIPWGPSIFNHLSLTLSGNC